jgi:DNA gyrase/topoisomerase IV subunit A
MTDPSRQASYEHAKRWLEAEEKRQAQLEAEQRKAEQQSIEERIAETKQRIAAADRLLERSRRQREREEARNERRHFATRRRPSSGTPAAPGSLGSSAYTSRRFAMSMSSTCLIGSVTPPSCKG